MVVSSVKSLERYESGVMVEHWHRLKKINKSAMHNKAALMHPILHPPGDQTAVLPGNSSLFTVNYLFTGI
jgi:hypothetical protein